MIELELEPAEVRLLIESHLDLARERDGIGDTMAASVLRERANRLELELDTALRLGDGVSKTLRRSALRLSDLQAEHDRAWQEASDR